MQVLREEGKKPIKAWVDARWGVGWDEHGEFGRWEPDIEEAALQQLKNLAGLPFIHPNGVAVMPDVHAGIGATVGSVIATEGAIIPAAVGVDIGCGMNAVRLSLKAGDLPTSLKSLRERIEERVPTGTEQHAVDQVRFDRWWKEERDTTEILPILRRLDEAGWDFLKCAEKAFRQAGSLGGGNHFIEVCLDESDSVWVMLHSGSRGIGNIIGRAYIEKARRHMERYYIHLPDRDLAYLPEDTDDFRAYMAAVEWAQDYALENRRLMMQAVLGAIGTELPGVSWTVEDEGVNCHHNYVARENHFGRNLWVTRKGAISARSGQLGIIPGSMGAKSYIVCGKGHSEAYCSCSHGAGRVMSRTQARAQFRTEDLEKQTAGVECRKDEAVLDEIPGAYKDIDKVMENQKDLVEIRHTLKQILCVKGA